MIKEINGDLIKLAKNGSFDVIAHGCNCFHTMGAGIARQIKENFPEAYKADLKTVKGSNEKLGDFSWVKVQGNWDKSFYILNVYTQFGYGNNETHIRYDAVEDVFWKINRIFGNFDYRFGFPKIGAGLAGGDWNKIKKIINTTLRYEDVTIVNYKK